MTDNINIKNPGDPERVSLKEEYEIKYWTRRWGITEEELHNAVGAVGVMVNKIEVWLRNNGKIK